MKLSTLPRSATLSILRPEVLSLIPGALGIGYQLTSRGIEMTTIKPAIKSLDVKKEVQSIREAAQKAASTKTSARQFLMSTGIYTTAGQIKPQYR